MSKNTVFKLRLTTDELETWRKAAEGERASLSAWIRGLAAGETLRQSAHSVSARVFPPGPLVELPVRPFDEPPVPECSHGIKEDYFCFKCGHRIT